MSNVPKAVLYHSTGSVWSGAVLLTLEEKGYAPNEIDLKQVDLSKGENFAATYLRINPQADVPTLVVPLHNTLSEEVESRYKAVTTTKAIIEFLDKSRSPLSRTHTTSSAPAPSLAPATISFSSASGQAIDEILHAEATSPIQLAYFNATDEGSLRPLAETWTPFLHGRKSALERYLSEAESGQINVTEKVKDFWRLKLTAAQGLLNVYENASKPESALGPEEAQQRAAFFAESKRRWQVDLKEALIKLNSNVIGPYYFGDQISIVDMHLASWLSRVVKASGGTALDDGKAVVALVAKHAGFSFEVGDTKLGGFWDAIKERDGWKKVYGKGLW